MKPALLKPQQYKRLGAIYNQLRPSTPVSDSVENTGDHTPIARDPSTSTASSQPPSVLEVSSKPNRRDRPFKNPNEGPKINDCWKGVKDSIQIIWKKWETLSEPTSGSSLSLTRLNPAQIPPRRRHLPALTTRASVKGRKAKPLEETKDLASEKRAVVRFL